LVLVFAGVLIGAVSLILIGACFSAKPQSLAGPATPYFGSALAKQGLVPTRAARSWRAGEKSTHSRRSFQLPPRAAASGFRRCFHSAAWLPARSSSHPRASPRPHSHRRRHFSYAQRLRSLAGPATPVATILAVRWAGPDRCCPIMGG
jgi:hypothetical protein